MRALACVVSLAVVAIACGGGGSSGAGSGDGGGSEGGGGDDGSSSGGPDGSQGSDGAGQDASQDASMHGDGSGSSSGGSSGGDSGSGDAHAGDAGPDAPVWTGSGVLATGLVATSFATIGSTIYFGGTDAAHGNELWTTDITPQGTTLVYDGCPGACSGYRGSIVQVNGHTLFGAATSGAPGTDQSMFVLPSSGTPTMLGGATGGAWGFAGTNLVFGSVFGLWVTDGTAAGTTSIASALGSDHPGQIYGIGSHALVVAGEANTSPVVYELFGTDGTAAGTAKLETGNSNGRTVEAASNGKGYVVDESTLLTITDGTPAGTNVQSTTFQSLADFGVLSSGTVIFYGPVGGVGGTNGLWASDGTTITQIGPEGPTDAPVNLGSSAIFPSNGDVLITDGTSAGTSTLMSFGSNYVRNIGAAGSYVYFYVVPFTAQAGVQPQLWKTDGTAAGTTLVADLTFCPASGCSQSDFLMNGIASGSTLAFEITLDASGSGTFTFHLWSTGGTAATTHVISDALPNAAFLPVGTGVLFSTTANDLRYEPL